MLRRLFFSFLTICFALALGCGETEAPKAELPTKGGPGSVNKKHPAQRTMEAGLEDPNAKPAPKK